MTHDEILTEIVAIGTGDSHEDLIDILGAVLDIHKPEGKDAQQCSHDFKMWPCPTIEAIEDRLGC
jgi:hypothetical protein